MTNDELRRITEHIIELPAAPIIVTQILDLIDDPTTSASLLARLLSSDQALTARILKLANSSYYAFAKPIRTVQLAISLLGFQTVANLGLSLAFTRSFTGAHYEDDFDRLAFWEHALSVAVTARGLARDFGYATGAELFTMGILHDIGKLIIHEYLHDRYMLVESRLRLYDETSSEAERHVLGVDHAEIGGWLCNSWRLPEEIEQAVGAHHAPSTSDNEYACVVHMANHVCNRIQHAWPMVDHRDAEFDLICLQRLPLRLTDDGDVDWDRYDQLAADEITKASEFITLIQNV